MSSYFWCLLCTYFLFVVSLVVSISAVDYLDHSSPSWPYNVSSAMSNFVHSVAMYDSLFVNCQSLVMKLGPRTSLSNCCVYVSSRSNNSNNTMSLRVEVNWWSLIRWSLLGSVSCMWFFFLHYCTFSDTCTLLYAYSCLLLVCLFVCYRYYTSGTNKDNNNWESVTSWLRCLRCGCIRSVSHDISPNQRRIASGASTGEGHWHFLSTPDQWCFTNATMRCGGQASRGFAGELERSPVP